jgi:uncharacterized protein YjiS (DUF1127 family)
MAPRDKNDCDRGNHSEFSAHGSGFCAPFAQPHRHDPAVIRTSNPEEIMQHTDVIAHRSVTPIAPSRDLFGRFWAWPAAALAFITKAWTTRRNEEALMEMPDHLLKDIGIARADISRAVREGRI